MPPVLSKIDFAQYVIRSLSYTYTYVLSKLFSYKTVGTSSTDAFVQAAHPAYAVISVGLNSIFGHPHKEVLERLKANGSQILTTGERGTITISTDGNDLKVETFVRQ